MLKRVGQVLFLMACLGIVAFFAWVAYDNYTWWTSPESPDKSHFMEITAHAHHRYLTPDQYRLKMRFEVIGASGVGAFFVFLIAGALLGGAGDPNITSFHKPRS